LSLSPGRPGVAAAEQAAGAAGWNRGIRIMMIPIFLCIGFMIAVLYMDLSFDITALPYRKSRAVLPPDVLNPIVAYYRRLTQNPWLLIFVMLTATTSVIAEIVYGLVPPRVSYSSLIIMGAAMILGMVKVIPAATRLAQRKDSPEKQTQLSHSLFPCHILLLILILSLTLVQFSAVRG
jgi:hypothetical protein